MRFNYEGVDYLLEFERQRKVPAGSIEGRARTYTTVRVLKNVVSNTTPSIQGTEIVRSYTVGCNYKDQFSYEGGRRAALTAALYDAPTKSGGEPLMGKRLSKEFKRAVWTSYFNRPRPKNVVPDPSGDMLIDHHD